MLRKIKKEDKKSPLLREKSYSCSICPHYLMLLPDIKGHTMPVSVDVVANREGEEGQQPVRGGGERRL